MNTTSVVCRSFLLGLAATVCSLSMTIGGPDASAQQQPTAQQPAQRQLPPPQFGPRAQKPQQGQRMAPGQAPGPAAGQRPRAPAPEVIGKFGDWVLQCENTPAPAAANQQPGASTAEPAAQKGDAAAKGDPAAQEGGERPCGIVQSTTDEKRKNIGLTLVLISGQQQGKPVTMMRVMAPIGVFLPTGVGLEIDGAAVGRVPFTRCMPQVCIAFAEATPPTLEKLKKGGKANFIIYEAPGVGIRLPISLNGFSKALTELAKR